MLSLRSLLGQVAAAAMLAWWLAAFAAPAASALSCASHPDGSPQAIVAGTEVLARSGSFRDHYDGAVFGQVLATRTQEDGSKPDYGRTEVMVDVTGSLGPAVVDPVIIVEPDPGWLQGYGLQVGRHYFIPYTVRAGTFHSHLCDPIAELDAAEVPGLVDLAQTSGWDAWLDNDEASSPADLVASEPPTETPTLTTGRSGVVLTVGLVALLAATGRGVRESLNQRTG
jgi:hypothetical protein